MPNNRLDPKKLRELASYPGTFPEMVQATYQAGLEAGLKEGRRELNIVFASPRRYKRTLLGVVAFLVLVGAALHALLPALKIPAPRMGGGCSGRDTDQP